MTDTAPRETTADRRARPGRRANIDPQKLRAARDARVWSVAELARRAECSTSLISAIENGTSGCSPTMARRFAAELDVAPSALLRDQA